MARKYGKDYSLKNWFEPFEKPFLVCVNVTFTVDNFLLINCDNTMLAKLKEIQALATKVNVFNFIQINL